VPKLKIRTDAGQPPEGFYCWLDSLSRSENAALASIIAGARDRWSKFEWGIISDWIEDHDGRRSYSMWVDAELLEENEFLENIRANPRDDTPRLAYADWLYRNAQREFAEFIRISCEAHRFHDQHPTRQSLQQRMDALAKRHAHEWIGEIPKSRFTEGHLYFFGTFDRGMPKVTYSLSPTPSQVAPAIERTELPRLGDFVPPRAILHLSIDVCPDHGARASTTRCWVDMDEVFQLPLSNRVTSLALDFGANRTGMQLKAKACVRIIQSLAATKMADPARTSYISLHHAHPSVQEAASTLLKPRFNVLLID
jgi:uncharacterized protein (TIGR02996 family)